MNTYRVTITCEARDINETVDVSGDWPTAEAAVEGGVRGRAMMRYFRNGGERFVGEHVTYTVTKVG